MPGVLVERPRKLDLAGTIIEEPSSDLSSILISYSRTSDTASPYSQSVSGDLGSMKHTQNIHTEHTNETHTKNTH